MRRLPRIRGATHRLLVAAISCSAAALYLTSNAQAGYIIQPVDGSTTSAQPTFLVGLDARDSGATVYVSVSPAMSSAGIPSTLTGTCTPSTPFGEPDKYTCRPSSYGAERTPSLRPGTYYWWMTHWRTEPGAAAAQLRISGPFGFVVAAPARPTDAGLVSPADGATVQQPVTLVVRVPAGAEFRIHASTTDARSSDATPRGSDYADCGGTAQARGEYRCALDSSLAADGKTYFWWAIVSVEGTRWVYGPRRLKLGSASGSSRRSSATYLSARSIPTLRRFTGQTSIKHQVLTDVVYKTMRALGAPRVLAFACWRAGAYESVYASVTGGHPDHGGTYALAFWYGRQQRWLHLSPTVCHGLQRVLDDEAPTGHTAAMFAVALHETMHAYGIRNEAQANCYAVQLVPSAAVHAGVKTARAGYLGSLAVRYIRRTAPRGYWNHVSCRDGGAWDLFRNVASLK